MGGVRKSEVGRTLDGRTRDAMPERRSRKVPPYAVRMLMINEVLSWVVVSVSSVPATELVGENERQPLLF